MLLESRIISQQPKKTQYQKDTSNSAESYRTKIDFHLETLLNSYHNTNVHKKRHSLISHQSKV